MDVYEPPSVSEGKFLIDPEELLQIIHQATAESLTRHNDSAKSVKPSWSLYKVTHLLQLCLSPTCTEDDKDFI